MIDNTKKVNFNDLLLLDNNFILNSVDLGRGLTLLFVSLHKDFLVELDLRVIISENDKKGQDDQIFSLGCLIGRFMILDNLDLHYSKLADYPTAAEEVLIAQMDSDHIMAACGFNTGAPTGLYSAKDFYKNKFRKYHRKFSDENKYHRGFRQNVFMYIISQNKWVSLPSFPGCGRQGTRCVKVGQKIYIWGGFSYAPASITINKLPSHKWSNKTAFVAHSDGYALSWNNDFTTFRWEILPSLPLPLSNFCLQAIDNEIYIYCGGSHHPKKDLGKLDVVTESLDEQIGQKIWKINTNNFDSGWKVVYNDFPGTPRFNAASCVYNNCLYLLGGIHANPIWTYQTRKNIDRYYNVLDNWKFDLNINQWIQLKETPISLGNWASNQCNIYNNRYVFLLGGSYYPKSMLHHKSHNSIRHNSLVEGIKENIIIPEETKMCNIMIYDLVTNQFYERPNLRLFNYTNLPSYLILNDLIYCLAGEQVPCVFEGKFYGLHSDLFIRAKIDFSK